ncbi:hypothetical protein RCL1_003107 [Eukaryota sp. TZLM3-RCL]
MVQVQRNLRPQNKNASFAKTQETDAMASSLSSKLVSPVATARLSALELLSSVQISPNKLLRFLRRNEMGQRLVDLLMDPDTQVASAAAEALFGFTSSEDPHVCDFFFDKNIAQVIHSTLTSSSAPSPALIHVLAFCAAGSSKCALALSTSELITPLIKICALDPVFETFHSTAPAAWECLASILIECGLNVFDFNLIFSAINSLCQSQDNYLAKSKCFVFVAHNFDLMSSSSLQSIKSDSLVSIVSSLLTPFTSFPIDLITSSIHSLFLSTSSAQSSAKEDTYSQFESELLKYANIIESISSCLDAISVFFSEPCDEIPEKTEILLQLFPNIELLFNTVKSFIFPVWSFCKSLKDSEIGDLEGELGNITVNLYGLVQRSTLVFSNLLLGIPTDLLNFIDPSEIFNQIFELFVSGYTSEYSSESYHNSLLESFSSLLALLIKLADVSINFDWLSSIISDTNFSNKSSTICIDFISIVFVFISRSFLALNQDFLINLTSFLFRMANSTVSLVAAEALSSICSVYESCLSSPSVNSLINIDTISNLLSSSSLLTLSRSKNIKLKANEREALNSAISMANSICKRN